MGVKATSLTQSPASAHLRSVLDGKVKHSNRVIVVASIGECLIDALRIRSKEERKVSLQERPHDHETSACYGEVGFDDAKELGTIIAWAATTVWKRLAMK